MDAVVGNRADEEVGDAAALVLGHHHHSSSQAPGTMADVAADLHHICIVKETALETRM